MTWRHFLAVSVGAVFCIIFSLCLGIVEGVLMLIYFTLQGAPLLQATKQMDFAHLSASVPFLLGTLGLGAFAALLSGCLAAWIGRTSFLLTGLATGIAACVLSIPFSLLGTYPLWYNVAGIVVTLAPAAMGGYLAQIFIGLRAAASRPRTQ